MMSTVCGLRARVWSRANSMIAGLMLAILMAGVPAGVRAGDVVAGTPFRATELIDLVKFPRLKMQTLGFEQPSMLMYTADAKPEAVLEFYRKELLKAGWEEIPAPETPGSLTFSKKGYRLFVGAYDNGDGTMSVSVTNAGNFTAVRLPRPERSVVQYEGFSTVMFSSRGSISELEVAILRLFREKGWHTASRMDAAGLEEPDRRALSFVQNGIEATVSIQRDSNAGECRLQYGVSLLPLSLPVPSDADWVELALGRFQAVYVTHGTLEETAKFLKTSMPDHGWQPTDKGSAEFLVFTREQAFLPVQLRKIEGGTRVEIGSGLEALSWLMQSETAAVEPVAAPVAELAVDPPQGNAGMEAADLPLREDASDLRQDRDQGQISFHTGEDVSSNVKFYREFLEKRGFKLERPGIDADDFALKEFQAGTLEISFRCALHSPGVYRVSLDGNGILWTKPLKSDNEAVSYETWLRRKGFKPGLDHLDAFAAEMAAKK